MLWYIYHLSHCEKGFEGCYNIYLWTHHTVQETKPYTYIWSPPEPPQCQVTPPSTLAPELPMFTTWGLFPQGVFMFLLDTYWNDTNHCLVGFLGLKQWYTILTHAQLPVFNLIFVRFNHVDRYRCSSFAFSLSFGDPLYEYNIFYLISSAVDYLVCS